MTLSGRTSAPASAVAVPGDAPGRWGAIATVALALATLAIYGPDVVALWSRWAESGPSNLVLFVGPLLPWLIWRQRGSIRFEAAPPVALAALVLLATGLCWAFASAAHVDIVRQALLPLLALAAIAGAIGRSAARAALFPLAWTGCAVMVWEWLTPALQVATARATPVIVRMVGVPAHIEGNIVSIPAGTFEVAAGCSGLNFFMVAVTLAILYGHLRAWRWGARVAFVAIAIVTAVAFNWIRVAIIVSIGQFSDMQSPLVFHHVLFGWCLYAAVVVGLFLLAGRWHPAEVHARPPPAGAAVEPRTVWLRAALVLALLAFAPVLAAVQEARVDRALAGTSVSLPVIGAPAPAGWRGPVEEPFDWQPVYPGASSVARGTYRDGDRRVAVDIRYFARQQSGMKLIASTSQPGGGEDWELLDAASVPGAASGQGPNAVRQLRVRGMRGDEWIVWQWYQVGPTATPSAMRAKAREGLRAFGATSASASVSLASRCSSACGSAENALRDFLAAHAAELAVAAQGSGAEAAR